MEDADGKGICQVGRGRDGMSASRYKETWMELGLLSA
jgi:hypothetical protein